MSVVECIGQDFFHINLITRICWLFSLGIVETSFRPSWIQGLEDVFTLSTSWLCISLDWHHSQAGSPHMGTQMTSTTLTFHPASSMNGAERQ